MLDTLATWLPTGLADRIAARMVVTGRRHLRSGSALDARKWAGRAATLAPDHYKAYYLLADSLMPGAPYLSVIERLHERIVPRGYVEIGVDTGASLALARPGTRAIGIDPDPHVSAQLAVPARVYREFSDDFFAKRDLKEELGAPLDFGFIDGGHTFEQALKDFVNLESNAHEGTVVAIHDCLPIATAIATKERRTKFWSGDVWKVIPCLMERRPDLSVEIVPASPSGLGIVRGLDPTSTTLADDLAGAIREYDSRELSFRFLPDLDRARESGLPVLDPDRLDSLWEQIPRQVQETDAPL